MSIDYHDLKEKYTGGRFEKHVKNFQISLDYHNYFTADLFEDTESHLLVVSGFMNAPGRGLELISRIHLELQSIAETHNKSVVHIVNATTLQGKHFFSFLARKGVYKSLGNNFYGLTINPNSKLPDLNFKSREQ